MKQIEEEDPRCNRLTQVHLVKWPLSEVVVLVVAVVVCDAAYLDKLFLYVIHLRLRCYLCECLSEVRWSCDNCAVCSWLPCISRVVEWLVTTASRTPQPFLVLPRLSCVCVLLAIN